ncbi:MAG: hypothetical protein GTO02_00055, partial [Candidatus Dadabacteria bacterium]|nr:hypothetical protein [Candidatus Dadabacteria bacterium]
MRKNIIILTIIFLISSVSNGLAGKNKVRTEIDSISALQNIIFDTAHGKIIVSLPEEILAGDMISGSVSREPKGKNEKKVKSNIEKLDKYSIEINNEIRGVSEGVIKFNIPKSSTGGVTYMILRSAGGEEWGRNYITYQNSAIDIKNFEAPSPWEYQSPKIGRATNPSVIKGPFDGNFGTTSIMIGDASVKKIAESPRALIFKNPSHPIGNLRLILNERGVEVKRKYSNIKVVKMDENENPLPEDHDTLAKDQNDEIITQADSEKNSDNSKTALKQTVSKNKYGTLKEAELPISGNGRVQTSENFVASDTQPSDKRKKRERSYK